MKAYSYEEAFVGDDIPHGSTSPYEAVLTESIMLAQAKALAETSY
jgi:hypothetical protein